MKKVGREEKHYRVLDYAMLSLIIWFVILGVGFIRLNIGFTIFFFFLAVCQYIYWTKKSLKNRSREAEKRELALDYDAAIDIWEELGLIDEAARVRKLKVEQGSVKVSQKVVHGDEVTEIKDSVLNRSNVGSAPSKMQELEKLTEMKEKGLIDDDDYEKMKREIIG